MEKEVKRILFVQTAHTAEDDRVRYHQMPTLANAGYETDVISTLGKEAHEKKDCIGKKIEVFRPDAIICDTPYAVLTSRNAAPETCKILFDITEWYPSKKNLRGTGLLRPFKKGLLHIINKKACKTADAFIFGEPEKALPIQNDFPTKPAILLPYFPRTDYIPYSENHRDIRTELRICYAGPMTQEKGYPNVLAAVRELAISFPETKIDLTIISPSSSKETQQTAPNLHIYGLPYLPFNEFCEILKDYDIFLDLRENDAENTRCLPIKLFYYMAAGRPMVYSELKAIGDFIGRDTTFIQLVDPDNQKAIAKAIAYYLEQPEQYSLACHEAHKRYLNEFNWELNETRFLNFLKDIL